MNKNRNSMTAVLLVVVLGAATLWAFLGNRGVAGPTQDADKIAFPAEGPGLDARIAKYFGRAPYFVVYDVKRNVFWDVANPFAKEQHAVGLRVAAMLVKKQVGVIVAQNLGPEPCKTFNNAKIEMYVGALGTVSQGIAQFRNGGLIRTTKPNVPTHYGLPGQKPCPSILGQPKARVDNPMRQAAWTPPTQVSGWTIVCPGCRGSFAVTGHGVALPKSIVCPGCGRRTQLSGPDAAGGSSGEGPFLR